MINTSLSHWSISHSGVRLFVSLQVYDHQYKAVLDGVETDSMMEIDPGRRIEIFRMGNGSEEVLEVHDFKNVSKRLNKAMQATRLFLKTQCCNCVFSSAEKGLWCSHLALFKKLVDNVYPLLKSYFPFQWYFLLFSHSKRKKRWQTFEASVMEIILSEVYTGIRKTF